MIRLALAAGALLATLLVGELAARLLLPPPRYHEAPLAVDPALRFRRGPRFREERSDADGTYAVDLNRQGLRGREIPAEPPSGDALRVLFVGDSFLVGEAVREHQLVSSIVEDSLRARGRDALVYNLSAIDWG